MKRVIFYPIILNTAIIFHFNNYFEKYNEKNIKNKKNAYLSRVSTIASAFLVISTGDSVFAPGIARDSSILSLWIVFIAQNGISWTFFVSGSITP